MGNKRNIIIIVVVGIILLIAIYLLFLRKIDATAITLDKQEINIVVGGNERIIATILPSNAYDKRILWTSSNIEVATVNDNGIITGNKSGEAEIKASTLDGKISSICKVIVSNKEVEKIELVESKISLSIGQTKQIKAIIFPSDATLQTLKYSSSNTEVATVNENGLITANALGNTEITITDEEGKVEVKCQVMVVVPVEDITIAKTSLDMNIGDSVSLSYTITPDNATNKSVIWEIDNPEIIQISSSGKVAAKKIGTAIVKIITEDGNKEVKCTITVKPYDSFGAYKHVFIVGVDGLGAALSKVSSPNFDRIFGNYAYRQNANSENITISAQNWGSILNGVPCSVHGYTNSSIADHKHTSKSKYLSVFYYVYESISNAKLVSVSNWEPINYGIIENDIGVKLHYYSTDDGVVSKSIAYINSDNPPTLMFMHLGNVDDVGHASGGFSNAYYNAVKNADTRIGKIYDAINNKGLMKDSLFIVVADHGMSKNGHGGNSTEEKSVVVAVAGHSVNKVTLNANVRNRDVSSITLYALGVNKPSHFQSSVPDELFGERR